MSNVQDMQAEFDEMLAGQLIKREAMVKVGIDEIALEAAAAIVAIPMAADDCHRKALIQCAVRDALERYRP